MALFTAEARRKLGEIITTPATLSAAGIAPRKSGRASPASVIAPPVEVAMITTRSPIRAPTDSASAKSTIQSAAVIVPIGAGPRPCPARRVKKRFAPSAAATLSGTGRVSSELAENPCT